MNTRKISSIVVILFIVGIPLLYVACPSTESGDPNTEGGAAPAWSTVPTVSPEAGGYTITAGTVTGNPEPVVSYYVAPDATSVPADETSESAWTKAGFSVAKAGPNATVASDGTTGGAPGALDLYAVAVNSAGHKKTGSIDFAVNSEAVSPTFDQGNFLSISADNSGEFSIDNSGGVIGTPVPERMLYYTERSNEGTAPDDAPWPGNEWPDVWTRIVIDIQSGYQTKHQVPAGDYSLYSVLTNYAGSVKFGTDLGGNDPQDPIRITVKSSTAPTWSTVPTVVAEAGGYTITAGTVTGDPEPVVSYYVAPDATSVPADETSESAWTAAGFSVAKAGPNATVASDGKTGGAPGALDLYAVAVNSAGHEKTNSIDFAVNSEAVSPTFDQGNFLSISADNSGEFSIDNSGGVIGTPVPERMLYYTEKSNEGTAPDDAPWPGNEWPDVWTRIVIDIQSGYQTKHQVPAGDYSLYSVLTNYAGSVKFGTDLGGNDPQDPIRITVKSSAAPTWSTVPTVSPEAGGYTITAGTAAGDPEPVVSYYVALDATPAPADETSESAWTAAGFSVAKAGPNATVASDGKTGGAPGALDLYAVAVNSAGHKKTGSIDFAVTTAAESPGFFSGNYPSVDTSTSGQFTINNSLIGGFLGTPDPSYTLYYTLRSNEGTAPEDAPWPGNEWPSVWTEILVDSNRDVPGNPFTVPAGDYSLYAVLTNYAGSVKGGDEYQDPKNDPIQFTVKSPTAPAWSTVPTVSPEAGGYTITEGTVTGNPDPVVSYYVAPDATAVPTDETDKSAWIAAGFSLAKAGPNATVASDGKTGGAPGDLDLYAVAVNSAGHKKTGSIDFAVTTAAVSPTFGSGNFLAISAGTGEFEIGNAGNSVGTPVPEKMLYYTERGNEGTAPDDAPWPGNEWPDVWTEIVIDGSHQTFHQVPAGEYSLYSVLTNYAGSTKWGSGTDGKDPIRITVK